KAVQVQFRYAFVCDEEGLKILDVTDLSTPRLASELRLPEAHSVYVARTYAYVAGGHEGLVIVDVENPLQPRVDQVFNAGGQLNEVHDVKLGITYVSQFAYLADGANGVRVVQLTSPDTHGNDGFSPRPEPKLVATYCIPKGGHALSISEGVDRDRAVDESGNQLAVFGRVGARPFNLDEARRMYLRYDGQVWKVFDGQRNLAIADARAQEVDLHRQLETFYGPSNLRRIRGTAGGGRKAPAQVQSPANRPGTVQPAGATVPQPAQRPQPGPTRPGAANPGPTTRSGPAALKPRGDRPPTPPPGAVAPRPGVGAPKSTGTPGNSPAGKATIKPKSPLGN
ncbi:MAG: hypothetical protein ACKOGA_16375, partial [Planctomycetaceae bacterium]